MVYAFNEVDPNATAPVWSVNLGLPESAIDNNPGDPHCNRSLPVIGVLGTPVITPNQNFLYVVSKNRQGDKTSKTVSFFIHKIDVNTGNELAHQQIGKTVSGFNALFQLQRAGLVWVDDASKPGGGFVYAAFGSHCDYQPLPWVDLRF